MDAQAAILTRGKTTARVKRRRRVECVPGSVQPDENQEGLVWQKEVAAR
jgi:hypothetical protein